MATEYLPGPSNDFTNLILPFYQFTELNLRGDTAVIWKRSDPLSESAQISKC